MQAFATQMQQLFSLMGEALQKSEHGAMGAEMSAMPSNLLVTAFKDDVLYGLKPTTRLDAP